MKTSLALLALLVTSSVQATDVASLGETWALNLRGDAPTSKFGIGITIVESETPSSNVSIGTDADALRLASHPEVRVSDDGCHVRGAAWDRKPVANVAIELVALHNRRPMVNGQSVRTRTDANGIYEAFIPQGHGVFRAHAPEWRYASQPEILCRKTHVGVGEVQSVQ